MTIKLHIEPRVSKLNGPLATTRLHGILSIIVMTNRWSIHPLTSFARWQLLNSSYEQTGTVYYEVVAYVIIMASVVTLRAGLFNTDGRIEMLVMFNVTNRVLTTPRWNMDRFPWWCPLLCCRPVTLILPTRPCSFASVFSRRGGVGLCSKIEGSSRAR